MKKLLVIMVALLTFASCEHYSDGSRAGLIQKFSKKGTINKTWEGELSSATGNLAPTVWAFSVEDQAVADSIQAHIGEKVDVQYHQVKWKNWGHNRGETDYFVTSIRVIK